MVLEIVGRSAGGEEVEEAEEEGGFGVEGWWHGGFLFLFFVLFCFVLSLRCVEFLCFALLLLWREDGIYRPFLFSVLGGFLL